MNSLPPFHITQEGNVIFLSIGSIVGLFPFPITAIQLFVVPKSIPKAGVESKIVIFFINISSFKKYLIN